MINNVIKIASLSRLDIDGAPKVAGRLLHQFAIQAARLTREASKNAQNKATVIRVINPVSAHLKESVGIQERMTEQGKPSPNGVGDESPSRWGSLGEIEFDILSCPTGFVIKENVVYARHAIIGDKERLQYTGTKLQDLTLTLSWHSPIVEDIEARVMALLSAMRERHVLELVVGSNAGSAYAGNWVITNIDSAITAHNCDGSVRSATYTVKLLEWVEAPDLVISDVEPKAVKKGNVSAPAQSARTQSDITKDSQGMFMGGGLP